MRGRISTEKFEERPTFTDNQGQTYAKNPYYFPDGLGDNGGDFTVGAVRLTMAWTTILMGKSAGWPSSTGRLTRGYIYLCTASLTGRSRQWL